MIDFRLANHCRRILDEQPGRFGLVEADRTGGPAIGECEPIELVENPGKGRGRETDDREDPQMRVAEPRLEPARERFVGQERVEMHGSLGHAHAMTPGRDRRVKIGQGLGVGEPRGLRDESLDKLKHAVGPVDEAVEELMRIDAVSRARPS